MTIEIASILLIIGISLVLFVSNKLRVDLVALMVLIALALSGLISPTEALSGFSSPAVITVWAVFILSGGLSRTGVANVIGDQVMKVAGNGQFRLIALIMLTAAVLSAFMNNVGVAALLLPVVMEIAHRTGIPRSKLLLPLAYGALLGGLTTLIGTPPNILASDALLENGLAPFGLFDFTPVGAAVMTVGLIYMVFLGQRLLPKNDPKRSLAETSSDQLETLYRLQEESMVLRVPADSQLIGLTLAESQLSRLVGLNVVAILRNGRAELALGPDTIIKAGDGLLVMGNLVELEYLRGHQVDTLERAPLTLERINAAGLTIAEAILSPESTLVGKTLEETNFRANTGLNVLSITRKGLIWRSELQKLKLEPDDHLLLQGTSDHFDNIPDKYVLQIRKPQTTDITRLNERLLLVCIPMHSSLVDQSLEDSRLGETYGLTILQLVREDERIDLPSPELVLKSGDILLVQGTEEDLTALRGLEELIPDPASLVLNELETSLVGFGEVVLSPHGTLEGKRLSELKFRDKYGLNVLAISRGGKIYRHDIGELPLRFGDFLLLHGPRAKMRTLGTDPDYIVLAKDAQEPPRLNKAPLAVGIMGFVLLVVLLGWLPIAIAAIIGSVLMVLSGSLTMEEAYRYIEWPAVFLIACMLPLGIALENSGAAMFIADRLIISIGDRGPLILLAGLFVLSVLASQIMPNPAVMVLMAPIAISSASDLGVSPQTFMMGIAIAASASFLSPVSHPANVLVMGPGGYRFSDYIKVGLPLTLIVFIVVLLLLPVVWPFN